MKIKVAFYFAVFAIFFSTSLLLVTISRSSLALSFAQKEISAEKRIKLYEFLKTDRANISAMLEHRSNPRKPQDFIDAEADYAESSARLDTSDLPDDFQAAWKSYSSARCETVSFFTYVKSMPARIEFDKTELPLVNEKL